MGLPSKAGSPSNHRGPTLPRTRRTDTCCARLSRRSSSAPRRAARMRHSALRIVVSSPPAAMHGRLCTPARRLCAYRCRWTQAAPIALQPEWDEAVADLLQSSEPWTACGSTCTQAIWNTSAIHSRKGSSHTCGKRIGHRAHKEFHGCGGVAAARASCHAVASKYSECSLCAPPVVPTGDDPCSASATAPTRAPATSEL